MYGMFIDRVKESLHIALAFSPIGEAFKRRTRVYPSIINCCTIDWYTAWPEGNKTVHVIIFEKAFNLSFFDLF